MGKNGRPKRFVMVATLAGQGAGWFENTMGADGLELGSVIEPMQTHRKDLILIDGINNMVAMYLDPSNTGHDGMRTMTTCLPSKNQVPVGPSIDQVIANEIAGGDTKFKSIQLAIDPPYTPGYHLSVNASGPIPPITDPQKAFSKLFPPPELDPRFYERAKAQRRSILDGVRADYEQFVMRVGREDKFKLQAHLDAVRALEARLAKLDSPPQAEVARNQP